MRVKEAAKASAKYYDEHREPKHFAEGQHVWLIARNIRTRRPSKKLEDKKFGPYEVEKASIEFDTTARSRTTSHRLLDTGNVKLARITIAYTTTTMIQKSRNAHEHPRITDPQKDPPRPHPKPPHFRPQL